MPKKNNTGTATQFRRTTISLTGHQMDEMIKLVDRGDFPDLTEAIRAAVNLLLDARTDTGFWELYMDIRLMMRDKEVRRLVETAACPVQ